MADIHELPDLHIIPKGEEHLHKEDINCPCKPEARVDTESGAMAWIHRQYLAFKNAFRI